MKFSAAGIAPSVASASSRTRLVTIGGRELKLSNPNKVLYPATGFTKAQVIDYYARIAPVLLPHLKDRPLTLKRYPDGVEAGHFYEKTCPVHRPPWVKTALISSRHRGEDIPYCTVPDVATLVWVANLASLELHTLLACAAAPQRPTFMVFDLDPGPGADMKDCIRVALRFRQILEGLKLVSLPKTSGGKGLHLYVPLNTPVTFEQTKHMSLALARMLESEDSRHITSNMRKDLRPGRVFIDWSQNDEHKTTVCAYSLRARPHPTVSTPITWEELEAAQRRRKLPLLAFETEDVLRRVDAHGDLFAPVLTTKQTLPHMT